MSQRYDRDPSIDDEYKPTNSDDVIDGEFSDEAADYQRYPDDEYRGNYDAEDDAIAHRSSLDRRGGGFDLTSGTARLIATLLLIAIGIAVILWAIRPNGDEGATAVATAVATVDPANATIATSTAGPTTTVPAEEGGQLVDDGNSEATPESATLAVGGNAIVSGTEGLGVNLREGATTASQSILILQDEMVLSIIGGPEEADEFTWWQVRLDDGTEGWTVQEFLLPQ